MEPITIAYKEYTITTDKGMMNIRGIHKWLSEESYWVKGISFEKVKTGFDNSFCIGAIYNGQQIGYARLITDYVIMGYLADVFVTEEHQGKGISKKMMETLLGLDWVKGLLVLRLATTDAHGLYRKFGFTGLSHPEKMMEIVRTNNTQQQNQ